MKSAGPSRRDFLGIAALGVAAGPVSAQAEDGPVDAALGAAEISVLESLAETLVPGASRAGIVPYIKATLISRAALGSYRILGFPEAPATFYKTGAIALDAASRREHGQSFDALDPADRRRLVGALMTDSIPGWDGPPASLFYFVVRNDAVDAVYGVTAAYDALEIPYMPHIAPPRPW